MATSFASPTLAHDVDSASITRPSRAAIWTGRILTGLIATFLVVDAGAKLVPLAPVIEASAKLGIGIDAIRPMGLVLLVSTVLHLFRRTQLFGAVLVSCYLGGATATHVLTHTPWWFPVVMGLVLWIAYGLRSSELRSFVLSSLTAR